MRSCRAWIDRDLYATLYISLLSVPHLSSFIQEERQTLGKLKHDFASLAIVANDLINK